MFIVAICTTVIWNSNVNLSLVYHDTFGQYTEDRLNQFLCTDTVTYVVCRNTHTHL